MDALQKPEADLGLELPSLLEWRQVEEGKVDHVVLGRGKPGGIWQVIGIGHICAYIGIWHMKRTSQEISGIWVNSNICTFDSCRWTVQL